MLLLEAGSLNTEADTTSKSTEATKLNQRSEGKMDDLVQNKGDLRQGQHDNMVTAFVICIVICQQPSANRISKLSEVESHNCKRMTTVIAKDDRQQVAIGRRWINPWY